MARLTTTAVHFCQRLQELYPQKLQLATKQQSEQSSPFRRWTTGSGAGSSYRHHDHRNMYNKQMSEGSAPVSSTGGTGSNVARWSLGLEHLLADPAGAAAFAHFLAKEFAAENIRFWWSCEQYRCISDATKRAQIANEIWNRHLCDNAPEPVNVDATAKRTTTLLMCHEPPPTDLFLQAQKQIFNVMKFDSYPRFLRSPVHAECARADLRGLPAPYAPPAADSPKLKKSASNVSERRRSSSNSLLPWKRAVSRERAAAPADQPQPQPLLTDVVKSSPLAPGQCSLCRVVLPDGATSVVGVDPGVSVGKLVDRLLHRRNLVCTTYDVVLKDSNQAGTVELGAPSTALGGREAAVERRALVRVEVRGRSVAVRCRPQRRLRHVLRPLLARYDRVPPHPHPHRAVLRDGAVVHVDTLMQELDGARLQIVDVSENGEYVNGECRTSEIRERDDREDDADSLSDVALRLHEDARESEQNGNSLATNGRASGAGSACWEASGRVRAALRPGPPLHHHPPDFLENLRETQRQMLQNKPESGAGAAQEGAAAPRPPPPLPPKPAPRPAPTPV